MKKLLSLAIVLALLLSLPGLCAFADGDSLSWTLYKQGTLTIYGKGEMPDYHETVAPWDKYTDEIKSVVIEDGITHIGSESFEYCFKLISVSIPDSVESIGSAAFFRCGRLKDVELPDGLTEIADQTFDHCESLKSIVIPDGVTEIGEAAFNCCSALEEISIPGTVTEIGYSAFNGCKALKDVYFSGTSGEWEDIEIGSYNKRLLDANIYVSKIDGAAQKNSGDIVASGTLK